MRCPYCGSVVEPASDTSGALFCPACQNTGQVRPAWPPQPDGVISAARPARAPVGTPGKAVAALVLGICAIFTAPLGLVLGPLAIGFAVQARRQMAGRPPGSPGNGLALAGLVLGIVGIAASVAAAVAFAAGFFMADDFPDERRPDVEMAFAVDGSGDGGVLTLTNVTGLGEYSGWYDYELGGTARCTLPNGDIDVGDRIVCVTDGDVALIDWGTEETLFSATV